MIKRLFRVDTVPAALPMYRRLMRFLLYALLVGGCGVGGVFLGLHMGWNGLAAISGLVAIVGIASGWILTMAQTVNVLWWSRPEPGAAHDNGNVDNGRRMSSGRLLSASELAAIVDSKGELHDCVVSLTWVRGTSDRLVIQTNDIDANFRGLPGYRGKRSGEITLLDAREIESSLEEVTLNIYEAIVESDGARGRLTLRFWPHGSLVASFARATLIESDR
jgi:hypothetical protein